jgi:hypothetical protein
MKKIQDNKTEIHQERLYEVIKEILRKKSVEILNVFSDTFIDDVLKCCGDSEVKVNPISFIIFFFLVLPLPYSFIFEKLIGPNGKFTILFF